MGLDQTIDITGEQRKTILALLEHHLPDTEAWVYGSRGKWTSRPQSDLDLVVFATNQQRRQVDSLREAFEESNLPFRVDLFVWDEVPVSFRERIKAEQVTLVEKDSLSVRRNWLYRPQFPAHWDRMPLYAMAHWVNGLAFRDIQFSETGKPVIKIAEIKGGISNQTKFTHQTFDESVCVRSGDLLFSWSGQPETSIDAFWWRGREGWLNQYVFRVTPINGIDTTFLFYLLRYLKPNFVGIARNKQTTGLGHVTRRDLENIEAAAPPLPEQRAIAHILGTLDDKIELNRRMNQTLEAMARALFKSWFVDFDPVHAKMAGRDTGLPKEIADLFPDRLVDSELGEIPEGWKGGTLGEVSDVIDCLHSKKPNRMAKGKPLIQLWNIRDNGLTDMSDTYLINEADYERWASRIEVREGDCLITNVGRVGAVAQIPPGLNAALGRNMTAVRCVAGFGYPTFVIEALLSDAMRWEIDLKTDSGTILNALNVRSIPKLRFVRAPEPVLEAHERITRPTRAKMEANLEASRTFSALRDNLLPKLVSGELRVKSAQGFIGSTA